MTDNKIITERTEKVTSWGLTAKDWGLDIEADAAHEFAESLTKHLIDFVSTGCDKSVTRAGMRGGLYSPRGTECGADGVEILAILDDIIDRIYR